MTKEIVDDLEKYSNEFGWRFSYGNKANQNLLQSDLVEGQIYLLLDPVRRVRAFSEYGGTGVQTFQGSFLLVVKSTIDLTYYNQTTEEQLINRALSLEGGFVVSNDCQETSYKAGKFIQNIKPLLDTEVVKLEDVLNCSDYQVNQWEILDVIDAMDVNTDGIIVNYNLTVLC